MESDIEDTIDTKVDEVLYLFHDDERFESKLQSAIWSLCESKDFTYRIGSNTVRNPNVYAKTLTLVRSMIETSARHHPETDFSSILSGSCSTARNPNQISNSNKTQSNTNINQFHQPLSNHPGKLETANQHTSNILNLNVTQSTANIQSPTQSYKSRKKKSN